MGLDDVIRGEDDGIAAKLSEAEMSGEKGLGDRKWHVAYLDESMWSGVEGRLNCTYMLTVWEQQVV